MNSSPLSRRQFVKMFSYGTAFSIILGRPWRGTVLADFIPAGSDSGILKIKLSDYPALLDVLGSVRIGFSPLDEFTRLPAGLNYPIVINRASSTLFYVLDSYCHHEGCVVPIYDPFENNIVCPCHGSTYAIDGTLISEGPASGPLTRYPVTFDGEDTLTVTVPGLRYSVTASAVATVMPRLKLTFPTLASVSYEVLFRPRLQDSWSVVPFAYTAQDPAEQTSVMGDDFPATVYVERPTPSGYYSVAIKLLDLTFV